VLPSSRLRFDFLPLRAAFRTSTRLCNYQVRTRNFVLAPQANFLYNSGNPITRLQQCLVPDRNTRRVQPPPRSNTTT
jgi:hypothetical protein